MGGGRRAKGRAAFLACISPNMGKGRPGLSRSACLPARPAAPAARLTARVARPSALPVFRSWARKARGLKGLEGVSARFRALRPGRLAKTDALYLPY